MDPLLLLTERCPALAPCLPDMQKALAAMCQAWRGGGRLYICGNGGSDADARHIVGELMKGFENRRPVRLPAEALKRLSPETAELMGRHLQGALPAHSLSGESSLATALANDVDARMAYAQQVWGYGRPGDCLLAISTSGNAENVCLAAELARALGLATVALTGRAGGRLAGLCDIAIRVPADRTADVQELHLPVYHALCRAAEKEFFT